MHFMRRRHYSSSRHHLTGRYGLGDIYLAGSQARIHSEAAIRRLLCVSAPLLSLFSITLPAFPLATLKNKKPRRSGAVFAYRTLAVKPPIKFAGDPKITGSVEPLCCQATYITIV
jgi:hypothetical protein